MSRRKDRERFLRMKQRNPNYMGFRGAGSAPTAAPAPLESITCSVCRRKRNVPSDTIPEDRNSFVCMQCQQAQSAAEEAVAE